MPDFPKIGGATAAQVAAAILIDPATDKIDGSQVDASIASRSTLTQAQIVSDATPFLGANVGAIKTKTDALPVNPAAQTNLDVAISTRAAIADYTAGRAAKIDKIQDFLEEGFGTVTADGTEQTVKDYSGTGKLHVYIDLTNMVAGNSVTIRQFIKIKAAGAYVKYAEETYTDVQTLPLLHITMKPGKYGVKVTLQQAAVVWKTYDWETLAEQAAA